jgi:hypothetical protein
MDLSLMEDLSDAEAMDEEEPPPKYREHEPLVLCEGEGDTPDVEVPPLLCQWLRPHQYVTASKINPYRRDAVFR